MPDIDLSKLGTIFTFPMLTYNPATARVGDWIYRASDLPSLTGKPRTHHGTVIAVEGRRVSVCDLQVEGYRVVDLADFADGRAVFCHRKGIPGQEDRVKTRARVVALRRRPWSLLWTCEDVAGYVHDGKSRGKQGLEEIRAAFEMFILEPLAT